VDASCKVAGDCWKAQNFSFQKFEIIPRSANGEVLNFVHDLTRHSILISLVEDGEFWCEQRLMFILI